VRSESEGKREPVRSRGGFEKKARGEEGEEDEEKEKTRTSLRDSKHKVLLQATQERAHRWQMPTCLKVDTSLRRAVSCNSSARVGTKSSSRTARSCSTTKCLPFAWVAFSKRERASLLHAITHAQKQTNSKTKCECESGSGSECVWRGGVHERRADNRHTDIQLGQE
jgi:hypothetical protein